MRRPTPCATSSRNCCLLHNLGFANGERGFAASPIAAPPPRRDIPPMETILIYVALGIGAGLLAGMLGVGGGQVVVPGLLYLFHRTPFAADVLMHMALGTSLATIAVTSLASAWAHHRLGSIDLPLVQRMAAGIAAGAVLGGLVAGWIPGGSLRIAFGIFLLLLALQMATALKPRPGRELPSGGVLSTVSAVIGALSAIVGVGGGSMVVPYLAWCNVPMKKAVGTASACGCVLAVAGTAGYVAAGMQSGHALPDFSIGYVYLPAWAAVSLFSLLFTRVGALLAHRLPVDALKRLFALFLLVAGMRILL